jgi:Lysozyme inhibitor LprI
LRRNYFFWTQDVPRNCYLAILFSGLSLAASLTPAAAQTSLEARQKIGVCIEAARQAGLYPGRCVGVLADPCIGAVSEGKAAGKAGLCAAQEREIWAARLNQTMAAISLADANLGTTVAKSQREWGSTVDLCKVFDKLDPQAAAGATEYCRLQATATRALLLEGLQMSASAR